MPDNMNGGVLSLRTGCSQQEQPATDDENGPFRKLSVKGKYPWDPMLEQNSHKRSFLIFEALV
jgi:hypothetical protein